MFHTVRYLRLIQIYSRIKFKLYRPSVDLNKLLSVRSISGHWNAPIQHKESLLSQYEFRFLNEEHSLNCSDDWDNNKFSKLWRYNLHYFDDLNAVNADSRIDWHRELLLKWVQDNPPALGSGWEPYPTSLRIVNWIKWNLAGNELPSECVHSLAIQVRWLSKRLEFHILGNHLFANAKALVFAGLFFEGSEAEKWLATGLSILQHEVPEQILSDGGHFELSPMYHAIILEDLLDLINLHHTFSKKLPDNIELVSQKMIFWLAGMCHPDGEISLFNDSAIGITPSINNLFSYAKRLGFVLNKPTEPLIDFADSGYSRVEVNNAIAFIDRGNVGPDYLPGHAHADTLSFELSLFGQRVIVNSGTSVYGNGHERQLQRSTAMHSTVVVDEMNSSEVWGGFRVGRRSRVNKKISTIQKTPLHIQLSACHDGYKRLEGSPIHNRFWSFQNNVLVIKDVIEGKGQHNIDVNFPLHPNIVIIEVGMQHIILLVNKKNVEIRFEGNGVLNVLESTYHPEFGLSIFNNKINYQVQGQLPIVVKTLFNW